MPQRWFQKLLGILKIWLLGEVFEPELSMFSKSYFPLPQSTYFVIAPLAALTRYILAVCFLCFLPSLRKTSFNLVRFFSRSSLSLLLPTTNAFISWITCSTLQSRGIQISDSLYIIFLILSLIICTSFYLLCKDFPLQLRPSYVKLDSEDCKHNVLS